MFRGPVFFLVVSCVSICFCGFNYFFLVLAVLGFRLMNDNGEAKSKDCGEARSMCLRRPSGKVWST